MTKKAKSKRAAGRAKGTDVIFEKTFSAYFSDCDPQGIVFYARFFDWAHSVIEDFWNSRPHGWERWFQNHEFAVPLRHAEANYLSPVTAGDKVVAQLTIARVGDTSIAFETQFSCDGKPACAVKTVHVFVRRRDFRAMPVPNEILKALGAKAE